MTVDKAKEICRSICGHLPLPGRRVLVNFTKGPGGRETGTWLANESPDGTPASSSDFRVRLVEHDTGLRSFEICPRCSQNDARNLDLQPMSYQNGKMAYWSWELPDSPAIHEAARGKQIG